MAEAFHFAACAKRLGRRAKQDNGRSVATCDDDDDGVELGRPAGVSATPIWEAWQMLACCDGMCGAPLGVAVKSGFDSTIAWLCCCLTYGGQVVVDQAERRLAGANNNTPAYPEQAVVVVPKDFDQRPEGYEKQESAKMVHPKPITEVVESLKKLLAENGDSLAPGKLNDILFASTSQKRGMKSY